MTYQQQNIKPLPLAVAIALFLIGCSSLLLVGRAAAAPAFQQSFVRLDTLKASQPTGGRVCVKPSVTNLALTEASIQVTFPTTAATDFTVNATAANWIMTTTNLDSGQTAMPGVVSGTTTASSVAGKVVTFPISDLASSATLYCFNFAAASTLTNSSAGVAVTGNNYGSILTRTVAPANIDFQNYALSIITDDAVVVSAIVPPSFTFVLNGNTDSFTAPLNTSGTPTLTSGRTITITSNAATGWIVWARSLAANSSGGKGSLMSATAGNYKITNTGAIGSASHTFPASTENYGLGVTVTTDAAGGGTVTANGNYASVGDTQAGTLDAANFQPIASANGTANGDILTLKEMATVAGQTPAGSDYTDTINFIGAGSF